MEILSKQEIDSLLSGIGSGDRLVSAPKPPELKSGRDFKSVDSALDNTAKYIKQLQSNLEKNKATEPPPLQPESVTAEPSILKTHAMPPAVDKAPKAHERPQGFDQGLYNYYCQLYVQGEDLWDMQQSLATGVLGENGTVVLQELIKDIEERGFDPAEYFLHQILLEQKDVVAEVNGQLESKFKDPIGLKDKEKSKQALGEVAREVWQGFVYSGQWGWDKDKKEYVVKEKTDLDALTAKYLLKKAGVMDVINAKAVKPGTAKEGVTNIDTGGVRGALVHHGKGDNHGTTILDNHQEYLGYHTSSSKIVYRLLTAGGLLEKNDTPLEMMVQMTVDDDNNSLINSKEEFDKSDHTLRGMWRKFTDKPKDGEYVLPRIYDCLAWVGDIVVNKKPIYERPLGSTPEKPAIKAERLKKLYKEILDYEFTDEQLLKLKVVKKNNEGVIQNGQTKVIENAKAMLDKTPAELEDAGRLIVSKNNKLLRCIINIESEGSPKWGGKDAVRAYGFDSYISYAPQDSSFLINTVRDDVDLSEVIDDLKTKLNLPVDVVVVRGTMIIKPRDGVALPPHFFESLLNYLNPDYKPQGQIKEFLEKDLPKKMARKIIPGDWIDYKARELVASFEASGFVIGMTSTMESIFKSFGFSEDDIKKKDIRLLIPELKTKLSTAAIDMTTSVPFPESSLTPSEIKNEKVKAVIEKYLFIEAEVVRAKFAKQYPTVSPDQLEAMVQEVIAETKEQLYNEYKTT